MLEPLLPKLHSSQTVGQSLRLRPDRGGVPDRITVHETEPGRERADVTQYGAHRLAHRPAMLAFDTPQKPLGDRDGNSRHRRHPAAGST
ncbi:hypothetical protein AB0C07_34405 [Actinoplanes missouriensis]|uniref:hypothetical protein n=1 Tax=Actinoplanes missouriensis TaxID=1866 RepID=UPI003406143E